ncbi:MAG TPA: biopolymer transporter ExbD [Polyangiaceae bacterium]|jgi:biopolymer transport protein ExbD|nr:biopolymer transporter ExbD [Polyangiaceae bacterium]
MAFTSSSRGVKNDINVTPLIDVVLVLLIIFMVVTPLLERGKSVKLPKSERRDPTEESETLVISMPSDESLWVEGTRATLDTLSGQIAQALAGHPDRKLMLKGDETLRVGQVREVMAIAKAAGVSQVLIGVEEPKGP